VTPINTARTPIKVGNEPQTIVVTPNSKTAYVSNLSGTVTPIDTAANTAGKPIKVGTEPYQMAITLNGKTIYVGNYGSGTVTPITVATSTAGTPIRPAASQDGLRLP
jgi:YVTN family beta-propeller protein